MSEQERGTSEETLDWSPDSAEDPARDLAGTTLGDFQVKRLLGRGGMGQVYLATQISLNRSVALKVLHPRLLSKPAYLRRFEAEATAVAKLTHPNIVHVYTLVTVGPVRFIAMEYVEGTNLREYLARKGALDFPLALSIMRQAGQAIGAAGEVGLIHRDIKPENLLLTKKGRVKVADFGLCRDLGADRVHVTQPGTTLGTPLYMSPEQAQGHPLDHRSDLYSLGVTFYHMLTGEPPFRAETAVALALRHVREQPIGLRVRRPEIPVDLERLVLKLMAKKPVDRYQSAGDMLADLAKIRATMQASGAVVGDVNAISLAKADDRPLSGSGVTTPASSSSLVSTATISRVAAGLARPVALVLLAAACLVAGAAAAWATRPNGPANAEAGRRPPGLALEPRWSSIPKQAGAEEQYRYAQLRAGPDDLGAAWLAVPGYFSNSHEWISPAYFQYALWLYRGRDVDRLTAFKGELSGWQAAKTPDRELGQIIDPALKLMNKDLDGVIEGMKTIAGSDDRARPAARDEPGIYDPGLLDFCVEVTADALRMASQPGASGGEMKRETLAGIQARLVAFLRRARMSEWVGSR